MALLQTATLMLYPGLNSRCWLQHVSVLDGFSVYEDRIQCVLAGSIFHVNFLESLVIVTLCTVRNFYVVHSAEL